jgi:hypothetical protein
MMVKKRRPKHVVTSKLHLVNKVKHSQVVFDSLYLSLQGVLKKYRTFAIKTLLLILQQFKQFSLQSNPLYWR